MQDRAQAVQPATARKLFVRLIPFLVVLYVVAFLDRVNVGFAALQMNADLGFSATQFGVGSAMFFVGYCLAEVPSNLILARVGARLWIARIMITWGLLAAALMFVRTPTQFCVMRFLLGVAEAGFFPGVVFYLGQWFPAANRARAIGAFMTGIPLSGILGGPLSGAILGLGGHLGLAGWQWLFLLEGLPAVLLAFVVFRYLDDSPEQAHWLDVSEKSELIAALQAESEARGEHRPKSVRQALANHTVWLLGLIFLLANVGYYGYAIWSPQIIKNISGAGDFGTGVIAGGISLAMAVAMIANGRHSDNSDERYLHVALPLTLMTVGFFGFMSAPSAALALCALALVPIGIGSAYGPFYATPSAFLADDAAAAGIALIASLANVGGIIGPALIGWMKDLSGGYRGSSLALGLMAFAAALLTLYVRALRARGQAAVHAS
jgi:ACS family tartrate transporter-like MFS transporter